MIKHLSVDIETYSSVDIKKSGLYKYAESPDFEVLLFAYSADGAPTQVVDLISGEYIPFDIKIALFRGYTLNHAQNAAFEWYCLSKHFGLSKEHSLDWLSQWRDTQLQALYCGLPASLDKAAKALGLPEDKQKMAVGKRLISLFCTPTKPTKTNGNRTRTLPHHEPEKWQSFKTYNMQDVEVEMAIDRALKRFPVPDNEQKLWELDKRINAHGVKIDRALVEGCLSINSRLSEQLDREAKQLTGLSNPNSTQQLIPWLEEQGVAVDNLRKETVSELLTTAEGAVKRVLEIRQQSSKTSIAKYDAMLAAAGEDDHVRGHLQFYGANRTGRWAGRLIQTQNLPRNYLDTLDLARDLAKRGNAETMSLIYRNVPDVLSQLIRTALIPNDGHKLVVSDFSAIEARVISWLAGEQWRLDVFNSHGKIYEASASQMFSVPIERIKKGNPEYALRQKGKVAELALGYQGGSPALIKMGALSMGLSEEELPDIVKRWRASNKRIVDLWYAVENAAIATVQTGQTQGVRGLLFAMESDIEQGLSFLTVTLPSGRKLYYAQPMLAPNDFGKTAVHYYGVNQTSRNWSLTGTYGGKLVENITQAVARDCIAVAMSHLEQAGYQAVMTVHDEVVSDVPEALADSDRVNVLMSQPIEWAPGLPLAADGFVADYYKKD